MCGSELVPGCALIQTGMAWILQELRNERSTGCRDVVMTKMTQRPVLPAPGERELTAEEIEKLERDELFEPSQLSADDYPRARNVSGAFMFKRVVRALAPAPPEYVTVPLPALGQMPSAGGCGSSYSLCHILPSCSPASTFAV